MAQQLQPEKIQTELKNAIVRHQKLVAKINDKQSEDPEQLKVSQTELAEVQKLIRDLSSKQQHFVKSSTAEIIKNSLSHKSALPPATSRSQMVVLNATIKPGMSNSLVVSDSFKSSIATSGNKTLMQSSSIIPKHFILQVTKNQISSGMSAVPLNIPNFTAHNKMSLLTNPSSTCSTRTVTVESSCVANKMNVLLGTVGVMTPTSTSISSEVPVIAKEENEEEKKINFMRAVGLLTQVAVKDLQQRRTERKRRSTANPQFSSFSADGDYLYQRKRTVPSHFADMVPTISSRKRGRPANNRNSSNTKSRSNSPIDPDNNSDIHEDFCAICRRSGELLMCDTCNLVYHLHCLTPPLPDVPSGLWSCPKCQEVSRSQTEGKGDLVSTLISEREAKKEEKKRLDERKKKLEMIKEELESRSEELYAIVQTHLEKHAQLVKANREAHTSVQQVKDFIKYFQTCSFVTRVS